jgi:hypothetical protein
MNPMTLREFKQLGEEQPDGVLLLEGRRTIPPEDAEAELILQRLCLGFFRRPQSASFAP